MQKIEFNIKSPNNTTISFDQINLTCGGKYATGTLVVTNDLIPYRNKISVNFGFLPTIVRFRRDDYENPQVGPYEITCLTIDGKTNSTSYTASNSASNIVSSGTRSAEEIVLYADGFKAQTNSSASAFKAGHIFTWEAWGLPT